MKKKLEEFFYMLIPQERGDALSAVIGSFLISYFLITRLYFQIYSNEPEITELFSGTSVFKNYYKPGDFLVPRYFIISYLIIFLILSFVINFYKKNKELIRPAHVAVFMALAFLVMKKYFGIDVDAEFYSILAAVPVLILGYWGYSHMNEQERICTDETVDWAISVLFVAYFSVRLCMQILLAFEIVPQKTVKIIYVCGIVAGYIIGMFILCGKKRKRMALTENLYTYFLQIVLAFFPLILFRFPVLYHGEIENFRFAKLQCCTVLAVILNLAYLFIRIYKKKRGFSALTFIIIGAMQIKFQLSLDSVEPINLFHNGELIVPMQQLAMYHKLPFLDFFPIHGICDYYFQFCNQIFLDGNYMSFDMGYYVGSILLCCITAYIYYKCISKASAAILFIVFFSVIGEWYYYFRFIFVLPVLIIFFYKPVRENIFRSIRCYIISSILSIAWYPAIGGVLAISMLPVLLIRCFSKEGKTYFIKLRKRNYRWKQFKSSIPVLGMGMCFVPVFLGIIRYLKENMGISQYFPGDMLSNIVETSVVWRLFWVSDFWSDPALLCFAFFVPILILTIWTFSYHKNRKGKEALGIGIIFSYMICSYTFGTIFAGERSLIVAVVLGAFVGYIILQGRKDMDEKFSSCFLAFGCLIFAISINSFQVIQQQDQYLSYEIIPDDYIKVDGKSMGYTRMGNGFILPEEKETLENIAFVINMICSEDETFMDFSNQSALYSMLGKTTPFSYTCLYHGTGSEIQTKMLKDIQESPPKLVLVSPYWENEGGSVALKNKEIYQYFMRNGYYPYKYQNICFLLASDIQRPDWAEDGTEMFLKAMTTSKLQGLPIVWGNAELSEELKCVESYYEIVNNHSVKINPDGSYKIVGDDPYVVFRVDGEETLYEKGEYLRVHFSCQHLSELEDEQTNISIYFSMQDGGYSENNAISFKAKNGDMLVPLYSLPVWTEYHLNYLRFDVDDERLLNTDFTISYEILTMEGIDQ